MVRMLVSQSTSDGKWYTVMFSEYERKTVLDEYARRATAGEIPENWTVILNLIVDNKRLTFCIPGKDATIPSECNINVLPPIVRTTSTFGLLYAVDDVSALLQDAPFEYFSVGQVGIRVGTGKLYPIIQDIPLSLSGGIYAIYYEKLSVNRFLDDNGNPVSGKICWSLVTGFRRAFGDYNSGFVEYLATVHFTGAGTGDFTTGWRVDTTIQPGFIIANFKGIEARMFAYLHMSKECETPELIVILPGETPHYNMEASLYTRIYRIVEDNLSYNPATLEIKLYDENANLVDVLSDTIEEVAFIRYAGEPQPPPSTLSTLGPAP